MTPSRCHGKGQGDVHFLPWASGRPFCRPMGMDSPGLWRSGTGGEVHRHESLWIYGMNERGARWGHPELFGLD